MLTEPNSLATSGCREVRRQPTGMQSAVERRSLALNTLPRGANPPGHSGTHRLTRWVQFCAATVMSMFVASLALAEDDYRGASVRVVSAPDCVDATNFVTEFDPAPVNVTYMRVQHIGDVGTRARGSGGEPRDVRRRPFHGPFAAACGVCADPARLPRQRAARRGERVSARLQRR